MEQQLAPAELLRFLQAEAETLQQIQTKISNELHHLQVEEEVFVRTLDRLNQNAANNQSSTQGSAAEETRGATATGHQAGVELREALHQELASAGPPVFMMLPPPPTSAVQPMSFLPTDSALPTTLNAISATETTETDGAKDVKVESRGAAPSGMGFNDVEYDKYELLDTLESEDERM